jgi:hypothetical protein
VVCFSNLTMKTASSSSTIINNVGVVVGAVVDVDAFDNSKPFEQMSLEELCVRKDFLTRQSTCIGQQIVVVEEHIAQRREITKVVPNHRSYLVNPNPYAGWAGGKLKAYCCLLLLFFVCRFSCYSYLFIYLFIVQCRDTSLLYEDAV